MESGTKRAITHLISHILQTTNEKDIEKCFGMAFDFINAPIATSAPKPVSYWERRWKTSINPTSKSHLATICRDFGNRALPMFRILHDLKGTQKEPVLSKPRGESRKAERRSVNILSESEIVSDLLVLLQGGCGNKISAVDGKFAIEGQITPPHAYAVQQIMRIVLCLNLIDSTVADMKGVVGQAIGEGLLKEKRNFVVKMAGIRASETSLLSLLGFVCGTDYERLLACGYLCNIIRVDADEISVINSLAMSQDHGNPTIQKIGHDLLAMGIRILIEFIRDWVVYGRLDDPYREFFIAKSEGKVESWDWWNSKYTVVSQRIPQFLVDEELIAKIVSGGRAWNFIRKFKSVESGIVSEGCFEGKEFNMSLVNVFSAEAMKNTMKIMMDYVWIPGHLRTLNDFVLFFRGDFAVSLFTTINSERRSEALNALLIPLQSCTNGLYYTNKTTGEKLTDRIDLQMKSSYNETSVKLSYTVDSPLNFVFDPESMANYRRLSQLLWKFKCCEYHLTANWKRKKHQTVLAIVGEDNGLSRTLSSVRHKMLTTVRALNEFISTDIVLSNGKDLMESLSSIHDLDTLITKHRMHVNTLMRGTLLANDFLEHQNALGLLIETINKYADLEDEIESIIDRMLDDIEHAENFDEEGDAFIQRIHEELADAKYQVYLVNSDFEERVEKLHALTSRKDAPNELRRLNIRLAFCMPRPAMLPK